MYLIGKTGLGKGKSYKISAIELICNFPSHAQAGDVTSHVPFLLTEG
jgi:hypothetical protein